MADLLRQAFRYCPRCGHPVDSGNNPLRCSQCSFVYFFTPISAVASIVSNHSGEILLLRRAKDPGKGKFGLPGGFIDPGESADEAMHREMEEELNLKIERMEYLAALPNTYEYADVVLDVTDIFFSATVQSFDPIRAQQGEVADWHMIQPGPEHLNEMAFESNRQALELYLRSRS